MGSEPMMLGDVRETIGLLNLKDDCVVAYFTWRCCGLPSGDRLPKRREKNG